MRSMMWRFYQRCCFQVRFCVILYRSLQHATLLLHGKGSESGGFDGDWLPAACLYVWKAVVHGRPVSGCGWARRHDGWKVGFVAFSFGHHRTTISAHLESRMKRWWTTDPEEENKPPSTCSSTPCRPLQAPLLMSSRQAPR